MLSQLSSALNQPGVRGPCPHFHQNCQTFIATTQDMVEACILAARISVQRRRAHIPTGAVKMEAPTTVTEVDAQLNAAAAAVEAGNPAEALRICQSLAEQNNATAQYNLGVMYEGAAGLAADLEAAARWYQLAADNGNAMAQYNLGVMYDQGRGVVQDNEQALALFTQAASRGHASAQTNLGVMYDSGQGVEQDVVKAAEMFQRAAAQGNPVAQCNLAAMYFYGNGVEQNFEQALTLYAMSAEQGNAIALAKVNEICAALEAGGDSEVSGAL